VSAEASSDRRPRVALTVGRSLERALPYEMALRAAGLDVLVVGSEGWDAPTVDRAAWAARICDQVQGLVLAGGGDIDPGLQGLDDAHSTVSFVEVARDLMESAVFTCAWQRQMPVFGICRGMQLMNWVLGGTLTPDIDDLVAPLGVPKYHRQTDHGQPRGALAHTVRAESGSRVARLLGTQDLRVNTIHHQAIERLAPGLQVTAVAPDGVIEAVEAPERSYALGVQFHPEELVDEHPHFRALFDDFAVAVKSWS
jgi:putative glutamine amidotransferase